MKSQQKNKNVLYKPQDGFQWAVHTRREDIITIGGTKGPGKTQALIGESLRLYANPHHHAIYFRRVMPSLQEIIDRCHDIYPKLGARWSGDLRRYTFPSGARIDFSHLENEEDKRKHQGKEYNLELFDQLEEFTEGQFDYLLMQNRTSHPGLRCYVVASHNPGGIGNGWINRRFVKGKIPGQTYYERVLLPDGREATRTSVFIRGKLEENRILMKNDPQYIVNLNLLQGKLRQAYLEGDYDILEGQYFGEFSSAFHVIEPFTIPGNWRIYMTCDWGYTAPMCVHWWAVEEGMRHAYCIREYYVTGKQTRQAAAELNEINISMFGDRWLQDKRPNLMYIDPSCFTKSGQGGKSIVDDFKDVIGQAFQIWPADNARIQGWNALRAALRIQPDGRPFAMWFATCVNAIRTIPEMIHDDNRPEDINTDMEDHACDADRYFFQSRFGVNAPAVKDAFAELAKQATPAARASLNEWRNVDKNFLKKTDDFDSSSILKM